MLLHDGTATSATLLGDIRDWRNVPAWEAFFRRYDRMLDRWCRDSSLNPAAADEIRQRVWIELARRMRTFRYDPGRSFRGWLRELCRSRVIDFLRKSHREGRNRRPLDEAALGRNAESKVPDSDFDDETRIPPLRELLRHAEIVQQAARKRLKSPDTWAVFWEIGIMGRPVAEVAQEFGMTYTTAFAAHSRASRILRQEGDRYRAELSAGNRGMDALS